MVGLFFPAPSASVGVRRLRVQKGDFLVNSSRRFGIASLLALIACSPDPVPLAVQLAANDPELAHRLQPAPGTWQREGDVFTSPGWRSAKMGPFYEVGARLPSRADGVLRVGIGQSDDYTVTFAAERTGASIVEERDGRAAYRGAYPSTDLLFVADKQRIAHDRLYATLDDDQPG